MKRFLLALSLMLTLGVTGAFATVELQLCSGACTAVFPGTPTVGPITSSVSWSGSIGLWSINLTTGTSDSPVPIMDLGSIDAVSGAGAAPLTISLTDTNFAPSATGFTLTGSGHLVSGAGTSTYSAYYSNLNTDFTHGALIGTLGSFSGAYATSQGFAAAAVAPFSLTEVLTLTSAGASTEWSTDSSLGSVPEPASILLLGTVLVGVTQLVRRRVKA